MDEIIEPTEPTAPIPAPTPELVLTAEAKYFLHTAGRWATFLGIMGFIGSGIVLLIAIFIGSIITHMSQSNPAFADTPALGQMMGAASGFMSFFYILIAVFYFFLSYYIYKFGTGIKRSTMLNDSIGATKSFEYLKSHFKLIGITTIVILSLYALIFIGVIIFIAFAASSMH